MSKETENRIRDYVMRIEEVKRKHARIEHIAQYSHRVIPSSERR